MCGIAGVVGTPNRDLLSRMTVALRHRGPDGIGYCSKNETHIGSTRLTIVDLKSGAQPLCNETGEICVVFNGEIYNHRELRSELRKKGHVFSTVTDTEVIVHLYEEMGTDCVRLLRGMFAFALLDADRLFLARDRLGIKPLYYTLFSESGIFAFASEVKALVESGIVKPTLDMQAFADFIALGHPVGERTFFDRISSLPPGHTMIVTCDRGFEVGAPKPYYSNHFVRDANISFNNAQEALEEVLESAVASHLEADVDVGISLSGGLDSSLIALLARGHKNNQISTFTVADEESHPDAVQAKAVAEAIGARHQGIILTFEDYLAAIPGCVAALESPGGLFGVPMYVLCRSIRGELKACLNGEGSDELFGGYREYVDRTHKLGRIRKRLPALSRLGINPSNHALSIIERLSAPANDSEYLAQIFDVNVCEPLERMHLDPLDKLSMASGVEMRVPYLDDRVFEFCRTLPLHFLVRSDFGIRKYIMRRLCLTKFGPQVYDVVLRTKLGAPSAGIHLLARFQEFCTQHLPPDYQRLHEFGFCFETTYQLLIFDLFVTIFIRYLGDYKALGTVTDFINERGGFLSQKGIQ